MVKSKMLRRCVNYGALICISGVEGLALFEYGVVGLHLLNVVGLGQRIS